MTTSTIPGLQNGPSVTRTVPSPALAGQGHVVFAESGGAAPPRTSTSTSGGEREQEVAQSAATAAQWLQASTSQLSDQAHVVASASRTAPQDAPDGLPTYAQVEKAEPSNPRFGRWAGWIEKRTRERSQDRMLNTQKSWGSQIGNADESHRDHTLDPSRDTATRGSIDHSTMRRNPTQLPVRAQNRHSWAPTTPSAPFGGVANPIRSVSLGGAPAHPLTPSSAIQSLGSRFTQQFGEPPTCSVSLRNIVVAASGARATDECARLLLVGTTSGLWLVDLASPRNEGQMEVFPLWDGMGIVQMELFDPNVQQESGVLLALVRRPTGGELELRMWSLPNLINLVRWRLTNTASTKLSLVAPTVSSPTQSTYNEKRRSRIVFKDLFLNKNAGSDRNGASEAGSTNVAATTRAPDDDFSSTGSRPNAPPPLDTSSFQSQLLALPLEWANASLVLPIPKSGGNISFFKLCQVPVSTASSSSPSRKPRICLYLIIATSKTIFILNSAPPSSSSGSSRKWTACREFYAPAAPRFVDLVKTTSLLPSFRAGFPTGTSPPRSPRMVEDDLSLLLGMSSNVVLIRLVDSSVHEITIPIIRTRMRSRRSSSSVSYDSLGPASSTLKMGRSVSLQRKARAGVERAASMLLSYGKTLEAIPAGLSRDEARTLATGVKVDKVGAARCGEGMGMGGGDAGWVGYTPVEGENRGEPAHLFTEGRVTYLVTARKSSGSALSSPRSDLAPVPAMVQAGGEASCTTMNVLHTFVWPQIVRHVTISYVPGPTSRTTHLVLLGFSATGVHAQEGHLCLPRLAHYSSDGDFSRPVWTPVSSAADILGTECEVEAEATLDFGRDVIYLGSRRSAAAPNSRVDVQPSGEGGSWFANSSIRSRNVGGTKLRIACSEAEKAGFLFAVQGVGDWSLKVVE
ncbi:BZ3500_MvSof-1268-A1-R1_Chr1-3g02519 [Microbotryum saponariae]|uniref:BZ3500_MvSof-1268-A1-R1_Chr1-3g02519 protein n=1 Tax=Microbotryum saponariae TaxID=289078 RepID=A0A2X0KJ89_9BASI|nr:BZ3500_MvSof-1268-A1-R1_Chr1-3g02519 [Microbotryum saponariae]SCZ96464.1 BZ3501_MvSof-1269-A2-R1_Chr1-3g02122 [Microbotryum saponariae]